jgi:SAM-dependent methyltransferase
MIREQMDAIYSTVPPERIPWNTETPPAILRELVESGVLEPCRVIEPGCGTGNYARYLAGKGFDVTGVDISPVAIEMAKRAASREGLPCAFVVADLCGDLSGIEGPFDFAFDWEVLHHVFPERRKAYCENVRLLLRPGGRYLSVFFSEDDVSFGGTGNYRETPLGTTLYFSSEDEMRSLYGPLFAIERLETVNIEGKHAPHRAILALLRKPGDAPGYTAGR